ncbi:MAG TPA: hypothetical protein VGR28_13630 [Candidatus Thermoplasmatota archaeon]|jgi:hypothetical protein|nr:hypothetical protein [Candidatus Thermoplasmatota archaeon]
MRLALDPAALAWALHPQGHVARAALLQHASLVPSPAISRLRRLRGETADATGLRRNDVWDLLTALLSRVEAVERERYEEFLPLAHRLAGPERAPALAVALAMEVDALLAGDAGFARQDLVPVLPAWPRARQRRLP